MTHLLVQRWFSLLGEDEAVAAVQSSKCVSVARRGLFGGETRGRRNRQRLVGTPQHGQSIEPGSFILSVACMQQVTTDHLVDNCSFAFHRLSDGIQLPRLHIQSSRDRDRLGYPTGHVQDALGSFLVHLWWLPLMPSLLTHQVRV